MICVGIWQRLLSICLNGGGLRGESRLLNGRMHGYETQFNSFTKFTSFGIYSGGDMLVYSEMGGWTDYWF